MDAKSKSGGTFRLMKQRTVLPNGGIWRSRESCCVRLLDLRCLIKLTLCFILLLYYLFQLAKFSSVGVALPLAFWAITLKQSSSGERRNWMRLPTGRRGRDLIVRWLHEKSAHVLWMPTHFYIAVSRIEKSNKSELDVRWKKRPVKDGRFDFLARKWAVSIIRGKMGFLFKKNSYKHDGNVIEFRSSNHHNK